MNTRRAQPWGLARVTYELEGDQLVRRSEPIYRRVEDVIPYEGESLAEAEARVEEELALLEEEDAKTEPLADGVEIFDIRCVHWADDSWVVSDDWDSRDKSKRNSMTSTTIVDGDPNYPLYLAQMERVPEDGLPSALEIVLGIRDPLSGRLRNSRLVVPLAAAQETWTPLDDRLVDSTGINRTRGRGITP
jgi:hypothetical protein